MSERESDTYEDAPEESMSGSIDDLVRDTDHLAEIVASQALPESEYDDDYIECVVRTDPATMTTIISLTTPQRRRRNTTRMTMTKSTTMMAWTPTTSKVGRATDPGHAGMFFLETEGADGNLMERHVRHLSLRELQQLLTYGMASFEPDDPLSDSDHETSGVRRCSDPDHVAVAERRALGIAC